SITLNPQTRTLTDGFLATSMLLNQGGDRIAFHGLNGAVNAAWNKRNCGWAGFADISGGRTRSNTVTNTGLNSFTAIAGISRCWEMSSSGRLTGGAFLECGNGSYDAYSSFRDAASVTSSGHLDLLGGGVLGRYEFGRFRTRTDSGYAYLDGSFRAGNIRNNYFSDLCDGFGNAACFASSSTFYGSHIGFGRIWNYLDDSSLDLYGKYLWSQVNGDSVMLTTGDLVNFHGITSHRLRFDGRYVFSLSDRRRSAISRIAPYLGLAWEHELDAGSHASANGFSLPSPDLRGSTGIGEFGVAFKPSSSRGLFADFGVQAYTGRREGVTAALTVGRRF
ncbi:MAG: autotransporter outer membrane beta-barrel domain-containing protein, partial [Planctomycetaceae bacterium]|nr:autotransporter outer membrane beta-barrel domain-containing protein [Planctomycetaceae bacterium]